MSQYSTPCNRNCQTPKRARESHCTVCHLNFYTEKCFDQHRKDLDIPEYEDVDCWEPESLGMIFEDGMWISREMLEVKHVTDQKMILARKARFK